MECEHFQEIRCVYSRGRGWQQELFCILENIRDGRQVLNAYILNKSVSRQWFGNLFERELFWMLSWSADGIVKWMNSVHTSCAMRFEILFGAANHLNDAKRWIMKWGYSILAPLFIQILKMQKKDNSIIVWEKSIFKRCDAEHILCVWSVFKFIQHLSSA